MNIDRDDKRLSFMPEAKAATASGPVFAYHDYWWCVCPERGLIFFNGHPQANMNKNLSVYLQQRLYPWAVSRQFPLVLVRDRS